MAQNLTPTPEAVDRAKLFDEFATNITQAEERYKNRRIYVTNVQVESVTRGALSYYISMGNLRFKPKYTSYMDDIMQDTVVNIVGEYLTSVGSYAYFNNCWFDVVSGGVTQARSNY